MKIGFLGGSFDPVHFGHLLAAQDAFEQHRLDRLIIVPAAQAPLKPTETQSSAADRLAMVRAATEWDTRFEVSDFELIDSPDPAVSLTDNCNRTQLTTTN